MNTPEQFGLGEFMTTDGEVVFLPSKPYDRQRYTIRLDGSKAIKLRFVASRFAWVTNDGKVVVDLGPDELYVDVFTGEVHDDGEALDTDTLDEVESLFD